MKPNNNIHKLIENLNVEASSRLDNKVHCEIDTALARQPAAKQPNIGRIIMKSPIAKLAAAAVIIIAVLLGIYCITGRTPAVTCCAWAQLADKVEQIKTCVYQSHMTQTGAGIPGGKQNIEAETYISADYGFRMDTYMDGNAAMTMYMNPDKKLMVSIIPSGKKYMRVVMNDQQLKEWDKQNQDPRKMFSKFVEGQYTEIGTEVIDGVEAKGIEVNNPEVFKGVFEKFKGRLWVDIRTEVPVRMEMEMEVSAGGQTIQMSDVMDNFEWDVDLGPDVFEPNIPADYTSMAEMKMPGQDEAAAIEGLRTFAELADGNYPSNMNVMTVSGEIGKLLGAKLGRDPNLKPNDEQMQPIMQKMMTVQGAMMFYMKLGQDGNEPAYYGDKVTAEFGDSVLMRWKISDDTYRVIFGNLTAENVSPDELAKLEAMPLNRTPKAIKPQPPDGTIGSKSVDLELSWMPGMYATEHNVYFGTNPDDLPLLTEASDDSNALAPPLEQGTAYYWRVDGIQPDGTIVTGDVWTFSTGRLVGWWKLDEGEGTVANDSSGNGRDGLFGAGPVGDEHYPQWVNDPIFGRCLYFDGNDYVNCGGGDEKWAQFDGLSFTVAAWVNQAETLPWACFVSKGQDAWKLQMINGLNEVHFATHKQGRFFQGNALTNGRWHHVVGTWDADQKRVRIYVDGRMLGNAYFGDDYAPNDSDVLIGAKDDETAEHGVTDYFKGCLKDIRIYDYALSGADVTELYESGATALHQQSETAK